MRGYSETFYRNKLENRNCGKQGMATLTLGACWQCSDGFEPQF